MTTRPYWVRRWEDLHPGVQVAVVFPLAFLVMLALHLTVLNQPLGRGLGYAVFWAVPVTGIVVAATRSERARRLRDEAAEQERRGDR